MFVASSGPGVVSAQVEAPGLCIECAHILCHHHNCAAPHLFWGETTLCAASLVAVSWFAFERTLATIKLAGTV